MNKNPLQYSEPVDSSVPGNVPPSAVGSGPLGETHDSPLGSGLAKDAMLAEVLKFIGQDCTQKIESYLERCETRQEGE